MNIASQKFFRLDPRCFKAFVAVAEYGHFTHAAQKAAMTQSSVSQHIARLEEQLGLPLFNRSSKTVTLTEAGHMLVRFVRRMNDETADFFNEIRGVQDAIEGIVKCSMAPVALYSGAVKGLIERCSDFAGLEIKLDLSPQEAILENVLAGRADFGIVDERVRHASLQYRLLEAAEFVLVSANSECIQALNPENLLVQRFVSYPGLGFYFDRWVEHFMPDLQHIDSRSLIHGGEVNSIDGTLQMVTAGLGMTVLPRQSVQRYVDKQALFYYQSEPPGPLNCSRYIVSLSGGQPAKRVQIAMDWLVAGSIAD